MNNDKTESGVKRAGRVVDAFVNELRSNADASGVNALEASLCELETVSISKSDLSCLYRSLAALAALFNDGLDIVKKERRIKGAKIVRALKRALAATAYPACGVALYFGGWRALWTLLAAAAFDWKLSGDSSVFIALTRFFERLVKRTRP